ncbi:hypothetical protein KEM54_006893 [Ascosphaera aggregata]|nr:hypothetical protein KEM54_006893 [Ascosphaera aggregata]
MKALFIALVGFALLSPISAGPVSGPIEHIKGRPLNPAPLAAVFSDLQSPANSRDPTQKPMGMDVGDSEDDATITPAQNDEHRSIIEAIVVPWEKVTASSKAVLDAITKFFNDEVDVDARVIWQREIRQMRRGTFFSSLHSVKSYADDKQKKPPPTSTAPSPTKTVTTVTSSTSGLEEPTFIDGPTRQSAHVMDAYMDLPDPEPLEKKLPESGSDGFPPPLPVFTHFLPPEPTSTPSFSSSSNDDTCQIQTFIYTSPLEPFYARPLLGIAFLVALFLCTLSIVQLAHSCCCSRRVRLAGIESPIVVAHDSDLPVCFTDDDDDEKDAVVVIDDDEDFLTLCQAEEGRLASAGDKDGYQR